jgi:hypothetical protein
VVLDILLIEQDLPLQIGQIDKVTVHDPQQTNSRSNECECIRQDRSQSSTTAKQDFGRAQTFLSGGTNPRESDLAAIAF